MTETTLLFHVVYVAVGDPRWPVQPGWFIAEFVNDDMSAIR